MENPSRDIAVMFHCAPNAPDPLHPRKGAGGLRFSPVRLAAFAAGHNEKPRPMRLRRHAVALPQQPRNITAQA